MSVTKLITHRVDKVWGRRDLEPYFPDVPASGEKLGEIWYQMPDGSDAELLVKYLFTSEKLSVQVHPDDAAAQAAGHKRGKEEAWLILDAKPGATVGIGTVKKLSADELRAAALDGSIEGLVDWKPAIPGQFIYSPAGTVHAIGPGVTLIEVQQNVDLTYRLYDYGRPRELHLDAGVAVSDARPFEIEDMSREAAPGRTVLCEGRKFVVERLACDGTRTISPETGRPVWLTVISGTAEAEDVRAESGEVLYIDGAAQIHCPRRSDLLIAYEGAATGPGLIA
ncbi:class I mannose-6-phosphate isomerase [Pacificimonas sp. WHA3]|uniref:Class I mannose-6-phosphate isomerase n=1 Tax=Pacificimonas pallii TaxID=2827236 RepID=A0ABS6SFY7_9SPHN|nr:class I mannose-6-phosphate isomerase [Pacificimonas pallii]MBV7257160.1 class I mannose-6-phosphate isomerase [Pacificimonas pallii]